MDAVAVASGGFGTKRFPAVQTQTYRAIERVYTIHY